MRISKVYLNDYRSVSDQEFEVGQFSVLFGQNNAGKTNLLEAIYAVFSPEGLPGGFRNVPGLRGQQDPNQHSAGAVYVDLEPGLAFDDLLLAQVPDWSPIGEGTLRFRALPRGQICYAVTDWDACDLWFTDVGEYFERAEANWMVPMPRDGEGDKPRSYKLDEQSRISGPDIEPRQQPLFLGWEFDEINEWVTAEVNGLVTFDGQLHDSVESGWFAEADDRAQESGSDDSLPIAQQLRRQLDSSLGRVCAIATTLLPDFLDGTFRASVGTANNPDDPPQITLSFQERGRQHLYALNDFGRGASRWLAIAIQVSLHLLWNDPTLTSLGAGTDKPFSGHILFIDEPEAHLHPFAVASVVRWCQRMISLGFNIVAATHHEEFLRTSGEQATFVNVKRGSESEGTQVRTLHNHATRLLQELAVDVGLHPAAALSIHRAVLLVEGPLDEAVLDEYAGLELDAAGVKVIPIHGSKNIEGLIDVELITSLGLKLGILTDSTNTETMLARSNRKRSSEEIHMVRAIKIFEDRGLQPPTAFGVPEADLLFALPVDAIRDVVQGPFPDWQELVAECRTASGKGPSDSVNWKDYARDNYGLDIAGPAGVRHLVRTLDLENVPLPSIRAVIDQIVSWARDEDGQS